MPGAAELHDRAKGAFNRGAFARASRLLDRAAEATRDPDLTARLDLTRAYAQAETGEAADSVDRCRDLLRRDGLTDETRGLIWAQVALLRMRTGDGHRALDSFQEALALLPSDHADVGLVFINRGNVHLQRGDV